VLELRPVFRTLAALLVAAGLACAAAPASTPTSVVPRGVEVSGIAVGGLTAEPARERVAAAFSRPVTVLFKGERTAIDPTKAGARADVDAAIASALSTTPHSRIRVPVAYSSRKARAIVAALAKKYDRAPVAAKVVGASSAGPTFTPSRDGRAVEVRTMRTAIGQLLRDGKRAPLQLLTKRVPAKRTVAAFGHVIVIDRSANTLRLYTGTSLVRTFGVATGQAIYPTPSGIWRIVDKQRNPWWYPPTTSEWARGLKPVPPGPSNPLGTRWMGLDAAGVGIHGTTAPTSIGYSASHGCIRMRIPEAEWLFEQVDVGTPVVIL
jgi:lipoprotein-anchoring transpeptidase ErfK/SrfK